MSAECPISLDLRQWAAWGGGLSSKEEWAAWLDKHRVAEAGAVPALEFVPPLQRRRFSRLSRMALDVAHRALAAIPGTPDLVFSSRHGEYDVTYKLLCSLARREPLSPAGFSMSVHNTGAGLCTIQSGLTGHATAVAAGPDSLELAVLDAWSLLASGEASDVLLVHSAEPLPAVYQQETLLPSGGLALALRLALTDEASDAAGRLTLCWTAEDTCTSDTLVGSGPDVPSDSVLGVLKLLLGRQETHRSHHGRLSWRWDHHAVA